MGGSLRRHKQAQPKIIKRKHKKGKKTGPKISQLNEVVFEEKIGHKREWDKEKRLVSNYQNLGLVTDANSALERTKRAPVKAKADADEAELSEELVFASEDEKEEQEAEVTDKDLRSAMGLPRVDGPAAPARLTTIQRATIGRLIAKHGDNLRAMVMDRKLNTMQHSEGVLRKMVASFRYWKPEAPTSFRAPKRRLWNVAHNG